jgi:hypothetical protein
MSWASDGAGHDADVKRRFTRLTNVFSKELENHGATVAVYFMYYSFARGHQTLRVTPAMEAGLADHVPSIQEIVGLLDRPEVAAGAREMTTEKQAEWWMGFACRKCGAPFAIERSQNASKSGQPSQKGWRVTCTSCGVTEYYEPGTPMVRITVSN